jgi:hypothetical protein
MSAHPRPGPPAARGSALPRPSRIVMSESIPSRFRDRRRVRVRGTSRQPARALLGATARSSAAYGRRALYARAGAWPLRGAGPARERRRWRGAVGGGAWPRRQDRPSPPAGRGGGGRALLAHEGLCRTSPPRTHPRRTFGAPSAGPLGSMPREEVVCGGGGFYRARRVGVPGWQLTVEGRGLAPWLAGPGLRPPATTPRPKPGPPAGRRRSPCPRGGGGASEGGMGGVGGKGRTGLTVS